MWDKDHALWVEVQKANWSDIILDDDLKSTIQGDVESFFKSEKVFKDLAIPWKRGESQRRDPSSQRANRSLQV
jgi:transitional endoplasmic reticulum ATPase